MATKQNEKIEQVDMKLEVVVLGVSDVDRAKAFYQRLGWRLDGDFAYDGFHAVQMTPHNSETSIIFGKGITAPKPGSAASLTLVVNDIVAAHKELVARGVNASEVFHFASGPFNDIAKDSRVAGPDPERRSYYSFVSFEDPDGNGWLLQEIQTRLPGREWKSKGEVDIDALAELLREAGKNHHHYETTHAAHEWSDWYAPYMSARQRGDNPEDAAAAATRRMTEIFNILPK